MRPTHKPIIDYLENLNKQLVDFQEDSFFRVDLDELFGAFRSGISLPCMTVESPEADAANSTVSASAIARHPAFTILQAPQNGNFAEQNTMLDQCEQIGLKIIARMRLDASNPETIIYNKFKANSVKYVKVGPIFNEQLYGYRFSFTLEDNEPLKVDAADWLDLQTTC
ncbi:hypothetical protein [Mesonia sp. HuA40]|uniref:hypothetical protein n=1 Tax=Mesonia sp. HuA40 TaxID=2602761 RepID=UPI0011CB7D71|nr:hypothetical protein [Mesonia sp. HuA40]TXK73961.1 hypothetical protein FT993_03625 [Mesonia sp. HuA40]